ncbi:putative thermotolerance protein [Rosellinia necatrix]|uniref:Putative thermotolerance protein n=1 Tax=Rosellinia necatrix TaxID=77044 RepID=A0A1S7UI95_ROSNE|nr:putative thermotolerance protein [Rosellinia necatrix]
MASLQTHLLVNDEWVTRFVSADELFGSPGPRAQGAIPVALPPPKYGVLTKTVIESPIIRWVHPVQLRSSRQNDVAFVGDQYVQISEVGSDSQLRPIARKADFGSKIINCRVIGNHSYLKRKREETFANYHESGDVDMTNSDSSTTTPARTTELFQQVLILVLSTGELVFLFMSLTPTGSWEFVSTRYSSSSGALADPGFHMAVSSDWAYLAVACSENLLIVYHLESIETLRRQHNDGLSIEPVRSAHARGMKGIIHKLDFLCHGAENASGPEIVSHSVLLAIIVHSGVARLVIYEWGDLEQLPLALQAEKSGHRLDRSIGLPILIIPLTISYQFLVVTEDSMAICSNILAGPPDVIHFGVACREKRRGYDGNPSPMWTAWTRPHREGSYHSDTDLIYLGREDGWLNCLAISRYDGIESSVTMGPLECDIDSAFACISSTYGDFLIAGGDCSPGGIWNIEPRQGPELVCPLPNWSPTVDLVLTKDALKSSKSNPRNPLRRQLLAEDTQSQILTSEKIFVCSGRGSFGAIVELRYGIQAKIGLSLSYLSPIKRCWAIPSFHGSQETAFFMLLALPQHSALLRIEDDLSEVSEKAQDTVDFDLLSTTLAVHVSREVVIQITTAHATILFPTECYQHPISDMIEDPLATVTDAAVTAEALTLSVYSQSAFKIMVFKLEAARFVLRDTFEVEGEVTALCVGTLSSGLCILAGLSLEGSNLPTLAIFPIGSSQTTWEMPTGAARAPIKVQLGEDRDIHSVPINAATSIICLGSEKIVVGMRNGDVFTIQPIEIRQPNREYRIARMSRFGTSPSQVFAGIMFDTGPSTLICNDEVLVMMKEVDEEPNSGVFEEIFKVWLTDASEPHSPSPAINSVARLHDIPDYGSSTWAMVSGSRILITELQPKPAPVPRPIRTNGTPLGAIYSERLEALVTVVVKSGVPSLHFFDPITGVDLSRPIKKVSGEDEERVVDVDYITYLGNSDTKVTSLLHWRYKNKGHVYEWFVILARSKHNQGRLLVVSAEQEVATQDTGTSRQIRFWTQFQRKIKDGSPRSGTTDDVGLFLNFGKTLEYHVIEDKKFKTAMKYDLPSPAMCLEVVDGHLHVLTAHHSLVILDYTSHSAIGDRQMIQVSTDELARSGLHSINLGSVIEIGERQRFVLTSDPMCSVYGLWSPGPGFDTANLQLIFQAGLMVSIRKFIQGRTRPRWARDSPRYRNAPSRPAKHDILGLAIDGSLTQFTILNEDEGRLLSYIQNLARPRPTGQDDASKLQLGADSITKAGMHVDGDILQRCMEHKMLERIASTPQQVLELQELLKAPGIGIDMANSRVLDEALLVYKYTYDILDFYLSIAL